MPSLLKDKFRRADQRPKTKDRITAYLCRFGAATTSPIADWIGETHTTTNKALAALVKQGKIRKIGYGVYGLIQAHNVAVPAPEFVTYHRPVEMKEAATNS